MRISPLAFLTIAAFAQTQTVFRVPVRIVEVPVTATGPDGKMIRGLGRDDFSLFDNDQAQRFEVDEAGQSFSLVAAVQTNTAVRAWLPEVARSASAFEALVLGARGEAAIITFADEVNRTQEMTSDIPHLDKAFHSLQASGEQSHCLDAIAEAARILATSSAGRRRILLLIAQSGDAGSSAQLRDVMAGLERENIAVYCLTMPRVGKDLLGNIRLSGLGSQGSRDTGFVVSADLTKLVPEIYRASKSAAGEDAVSVLTRYTGGTMLPFRKRTELDAALSAVGEELHTGYLLTYTGSDSSSGYHRIEVRVEREGASVRARPGYFIAQPPY
jgi:VWFA-related protein